MRGPHRDRQPGPCPAPGAHAGTREVGMLAPPQYTATRERKSLNSRWRFTLDPSRPVGFVNVMLAPADKDMVADLFDVVMLNRYYGWYVNTGDLPAAERALEAELNAWAAKLGKPIIMPGYGAGTLPGLHSVIPAPEPRSTR